jgi:type IV pilus assembly PilN-like protein
MRAVNLLPEDSRRTRVVAPSRSSILAVVAVALIGAFGAWAWSVHRDADSARSDLASVRAEALALQGRLAAMPPVDDTATRVTAARRQVVALADGRINAERLIRLVATVTPHTAWYQTLTYNPPAAQDGAAAPPPRAGAPQGITDSGGIHLDGYAYSPAQVARLMGRLARLPGLGAPRLVSTQDEKQGGRSVQHFQIDVPLPSGAGTATGAELWTAKEDSP